MKQREKGGCAKLIVRAQHNRLLVKEKREEKDKLRQKLEEAPSLGEIEFTIPPTEKRSGRKVKQ